MPNKKSDSPAPKGTFKRIISHDDKPNFWKPTKYGEKIMGKLLAVTETDKSPVLQVELFNGLIQQVGVSTQLKKVPWANFVGKEICITYSDSAKSKYGQPVKLYDVDVAE